MIQQYHSQNNEAQTVIEYFAGKVRVGNILSLGENDGKFLSNSYDLIKMGWGGDLFEPIKGNADKIVALHAGNPLVRVHNYGIANDSGEKPLYVSGGSVIAVLDPKLLEEWKYPLEYETMCSFLSFKDARETLLAGRKYEFITIDCEGMDWDILQQMDLGDLGCECICLEQGNSPENYRRMKEYCAKFGLTKEILYNFENVILAK